MDEVIHMVPCPKILNKKSIKLEQMIVEKSRICATPSRIDPIDEKPPAKIRKQATASDTCTESIQIPKKFLGLVIGIGGKKINELSSTTKCSIKIRSETGICNISGPKEGVELAKKEIEEVVNFNKAKMISELYKILGGVQIDDIDGLLYESIMENIMTKGMQGVDEFSGYISTRNFELLKDKLRESDFFMKTFLNNS